MNNIEKNISHPFLCTDTGKMKIFEFNSKGEITWEYYLGKICFDTWLLEDNTILYCYYSEGGIPDSGVKIINRKGEILFSYETQYEVFGCQPLKNGNILIGELRKRRIIEVNRNGNIEVEFNIDYSDENLHEAMRMPRKMEDGTYIVIQPGNKKIIRYDNTGKILWKANTRPDTFGFVQRPNGNIVYTSKTELVELDKNGNEIWTVTADQIPEISVQWLLGIQLMDNGNLVVCNWLGHGHENEGLPLFEINKDKKIIWICNCQDITENMSNFELLDNDITKAYTIPTR